MLSRKKLTLPMLFVCLVTVGVAFSAPATSRPKTWSTNFEAALAASKQQDKPLLVHFYAPWCGPCRQMDAEVLKSAQLAKQVRGRVIAVKVDTDRRSDLVRRYGIESLPTDLMIDSNGKVMYRTAGYQSPGEYLAVVNRYYKRFDAAKQIRIAAKALAEEPPGKVSISDGLIAKTEPTERPSVTSVSEGATKTILGMEGYSPVSLWNGRKWVKGSKKFASVYKGITFYMASQAELDEFESEPLHYSPRLLGCDPVIMSQSDRAVAGSVRYGAYYGGELYMFVSDDNRKRFKAAPLSFSRTRHVIKTDQIEGTVLR